MKALTSLLKPRTLLSLTGTPPLLLCRFFNDTENRGKYKLKEYSDINSNKYNPTSSSNRFADGNPGNRPLSTKYSSRNAHKYSNKDAVSDSEGDSDDGEGDEDDVNTQRYPLIPKEVHVKIFNRKPVTEQQKRRFLSFRKDIQRLSKTGTTDSIEGCFHMYLADNPTSHFVSSQVLKQMSTAFSIAGDIDRCEELLKLYRRLKRHQIRDHQQDNLHALIVTSYLLSLTCSADTERAKQLASTFLNETNNNSQTVHPIVRNTLTNVLRELGLFSELEESVRVSSTLSPGSLLDTVQQKIDSGDKIGAGQIFEEHVQHVDCSHANADHFAQLAKVVSVLYEAPAYKEIALFCGVPIATLKDFSHFPSPLLKNSTVCKNYELVLHIARQKDNLKLFRIIGGRNGLTRQLYHVSTKEYITMVQYIYQLCQYADIGLDISFWNSLFSQLFYISGRRCDYYDIQALHAVIRIYPLTSQLWCRTIRSVQIEQLPLVLKDLVQVGLMDDAIYTAFVTRTEGSSMLAKEMQQLSGFYSLLSNENKPSNKLLDDS